MQNQWNQSILTITSIVQPFLRLRPAMTFFFKSETEKHLKEGSRSGKPEDELPLLEERSLTRSRESGRDEVSEPLEEEEEESFVAILSRECSPGAYRRSP
ncbi:hypothetical protein FF1_018899 [Malus domestica]